MSVRVVLWMTYILKKKTTTFMKMKMSLLQKTGEGATQPGAFIERVDSPYRPGSSAILSRIDPALMGSGKGP